MKAHRQHRNSENIEENIKSENEEISQRGVSAASSAAAANGNQRKMQAKALNRNSVSIMKISKKVAKNRRACAPAARVAAAHHGNNGEKPAAWLAYRRLCA
jgi:hypothetical protein